MKKRIFWRRIWGRKEVKKIMGAAQTVEVVEAAEAAEAAEEAETTAIKIRPAPPPILIR